MFAGDIIGVFIRIYSKKTYSQIIINNLNEPFAATFGL